MSYVRCQAKDPSTCRFHGSNASTEAYHTYMQAYTAYNSATSLNEKEKAQEAMNVAQDVYDATDEGMAKMKKDLRQARSDEDWNKITEYTMRMLKAKAARNGDLQTGAATDVKFIEDSDMTNKMNSLKQMLQSGDSDHFYDVYDKYAFPLKKAVEDYDTHEFARVYNSLIDDLALEGAESNWFDAKRGSQWVSGVKDLKLKGKFFRSRIPFDNLNTPMSFTV